MAVLLDVESWPATAERATINQGHVKNPQKTRYLNADHGHATPIPRALGRTAFTATPGAIPTSSPIDLNYDDKARDAFYRDPSRLGGSSDPNRGLNGLMLKMNGTGIPK